MIEKRRAKRTDVDLQLKVSSLFKQDNVKITNIDAPIEVLNISKTGIGFLSKSILPLDFYFNAALQLGNKSDILYSVVKIVRCEPVSADEYQYGCEFVGMAPILNYIFDEIEE